MYVAKYNPILPTAAGFIILTSTNKIIKMMSAAAFKPWLAAFQAVILVVAAIAFIMLLVRKHIVATEEVVSIRESCMRNPKEIKIEEMIEARWGVKETGIWTKGKKQFIVGMRNGEEVRLSSLNWLPSKERAHFFDYLRARGVKVVEQA